MTIVFGHKTDVGRHRKQNEDFVWFDEATGLYIVADGMGGHEAGEIASELTATTVGHYLAERLTPPDLPPPDTVQTLMTEAIETANVTVREAAEQAGQKRKMGSTVVVALVQPPQVYISHAGDTRAYLLHETELTQLTKDDSWGNSWGKQTTSTVRSKVDHILTKAVGLDTALDPSFTTVTVQPDDWLLLCSDGLWNMVPEPDIIAELRHSDHSPAEIVDALVDAANEAGGKDNISLIAIKIG